MKTHNFLRSFVMLSFCSLMLACTGNEPTGDENYGGDDAKDEESTWENASAKQNTEYSGNETPGMRQFAMEAASDGMMEVRMGEIAMRKAKNQAVRDLAEVIRKDHQLANDKLKEIADNNNWDLPSDMMEKHQQMVEELENATEANFDRQYLQMMVKGHQKAIAKFEETSNGDGKQAQNLNNESTNDDNDQGTQNQIDPENNNTASAAQNDGERPAMNNQQNNNGEMGMDRTDSGVVAYNQDLQNWIDNTLPVLRKHLERSQDLLKKMK